MAWAKVIQIACPASTGNQTYNVTGVGSAPVGFIAVHGSQTTTGFTGEYRYGVGFGVSSSQRIATASASANGEATSIARRRQDPGKCITCINPAGSIIFDADLVSFGTSGSDGTITLNWTTVSEGMQVNLLVFGGAGVEASVVTATTAASSYAHGLSAAPDYIAATTISNNSNSAATLTTLAQSIGVWAGGNQYALTNRSVHDAGTSDTKSIQAAGRLFYMAGSGSSGIGNAEVTSVDATDVNWTIRNKDGPNRRSWQLNVTGIMARVGAINSPTAGTPPVAQDITLTDMDPLAGLFGTWMRATSGDEQNPAKFGIGVADNDNEYVIGCYDEHGADTTNSARFSLVETVQITNINETNLAQATSTFASEKVTLSWNPIDSGESHEVFYLILGNEASGGDDRDVSGSLTLPALTLSGAVDTTVPEYDATAALELPAVTLSGEVTADTPDADVSGSLTLSPLTLSSAVEAAPPEFDVTGTLTLGALTLSASVDAEVPEYDVSGTLTLAPVTLSASVDATLPEGAVVGSLTLSPLTLSGTVDAEVPTFDVAGTLTIGAVTLSGAVETSVEDVDVSGALTLPAVLLGGSVVVATQPEVPGPVPYHYWWWIGVGVDTYVPSDAVASPVIVHAAAFSPGPISAAAWNPGAISARVIE